MSEQHAALLKKARERLVEGRRDHAKTIAAPFEREKTRDAREKFIDIQAVIEAVDRRLKTKKTSGCLRRLAGHTRCERVQVNLAF